jgi:mono/diheme cytochrome c family protein
MKRARYALSLPFLAIFPLLASLAPAVFWSASANAEVDKKILRTWKAKCSSCHGEDGKGATEQGKKMGVRDMTAPDFWKGLTDAKMKDAISNGIKQTKDGKVQEMEPYKDKIKPEDIDALVGYVKTFKK